MPDQKNIEKPFVPMISGPKTIVKPLVPMVLRPKPLVPMVAFQTIHAMAKLKFVTQKKKSQGQKFLSGEN